MKRFIAIALLTLAASSSFAQQRGTTRDRTLIGIDSVLANGVNLLRRLDSLQAVVQNLSIGATSGDTIEDSLNNGSRVMTRPWTFDQLGTFNAGLVTSANVVMGNPGSATGAAVFYHNSSSFYSRVMSPVQTGDRTFFFPLISGSQEILAVQGWLGARSMDTTNLVAGRMLIFNGTSWVLIDSSAVGGGGSTSWAGLATGTNTSATLTVGTGAVLLASGAGVIDATRYLGVTTISSAEFSNLDNSTSNIQAQLNNKVRLDESISQKSYGVVGGSQRFGSFLATESDAADTAEFGLGVTGAAFIRDAITGTRTLAQLAERAFSSLTSATNTTATMTVGTGGTINYSGSGVINATHFLGITSVDAAEFSFLNGVTSLIQTQLDLRALASRLISTQYSLTGGGSLTADRTLNLVGDVLSPAASQYYGTNGASTRGWYNLPAATISDVAYGISWNGVVTDGASKNALYDKIELLMTASAFGDSAKKHSIGKSFGDTELVRGVGTDSIDGDPSLTWTNTANAQSLNIRSGTAPGEIKIYEGSAAGTDYVSLRASNSVATPVVVTLPTGAGVIALQSEVALKTDKSRIQTVAETGLIDSVATADTIAFGFTTTVLTLDTIYVHSIGAVNVTLKVQMVDSLNQTVGVTDITAATAVTNARKVIIPSSTTWTGLKLLRVVFTAVGTEPKHIALYGTAHE